MHISYVEFLQQCFFLLVYLESHKICKSNFSNTWEKQFLNVCKSNIYRRNLNRAHFDKRKWNFSSNNNYKLTLPSRLQKMQQQEGVEEVLDDVRIRINFRWSFWGELKNSNDDLLIQTQTSDQTFLKFDLMFVPRKRCGLHERISMQCAIILCTLEFVDTII